MVAVCFNFIIYIKKEVLMYSNKKVKMILAVMSFYNLSELKKANKETRKAFVKVFSK